MLQLPHRRVLMDDRYEPVRALGSDLLAYWDAARSDLITVVTGVSSWRDIVAGYDATQATASAQPGYSPTSFNGALSLAFDGIDDCLAITSGPFLSAVPAGSSAYEVWSLVQQDAAHADTSTRCLMSLGSGTGAGRSLGRSVTIGFNRSRGHYGDGTNQNASNGANVNLSARHAIRLEFTAADFTLTTDGIIDRNLALTAPPGATINTRFRVGAFDNPSASLFWQGQIAAVLITSPLSPGKAAALQRYLMNRRRL
jgi:hypothetical protein